MIMEKKKNVAKFTHSGDAQRLMCVASTVHAKAPGGSAVEGDLSGAHPASTGSTASLTHASEFPAFLSTRTSHRESRRIQSEATRVGVAYLQRPHRNLLSCRTYRNFRRDEGGGARTETGRAKRAVDDSDDDDDDVWTR